MTQKRTVEDRSTQDAPVDIHELLRRDVEGFTEQDLNVICASERAYALKLSAMKAEGKKPRGKKAKE